MGETGGLDRQHALDFSFLHAPRLVDLRGLDAQVAFDLALLYELFLLYPRGLYAQQLLDLALLHALLLRDLGAFNLELGGVFRLLDTLVLLVLVYEGVGFLLGGVGRDVPCLFGLGPGEILVQGQRLALRVDGDLGDADICLELDSLGFAAHFLGDLGDLADALRVELVVRIHGGERRLVHAYEGHGLQCEPVLLEVAEYRLLHGLAELGALLQEVL